jgi:hypothetical protein
MKQFATRKEIKSRFNTIIKTGASNLQHLLTFKDPDYYWSGESGWYCDIYVINGIAICTGYQSFGNIDANNEFCRPFEERAREILKETMDYKKQNELLNNLIADFVGTAIGRSKRK